MKKLLSLIILMAFSSVCFAYAPSTSIQTNTNPSIFRTNSYDGTSRGGYVNTTVPNLGLTVLLAQSAPATANVQTGSIVLYFDSTTSNVEIRYIAKDNAGTATAGELF